MRPLAKMLRRLESLHGVQAARWPTDPGAFLIWWHCGYPPAEERCARGWEALREEIGVEPAQLRAAGRARLARALGAGGSIAALRAARILEIATRVETEFGGDLAAALAAATAPAQRRILRSFPGIGAPGTDRILLFAGLVPCAAVPSACPEVAVRMLAGAPRGTYAQTYAQAQRLLEAALPRRAPARVRAYLLLGRHGHALCRRREPRCGDCPIAPECAYAAARRRRASRDRAAIR